MPQSPARMGRSARPGPAPDCRQAHVG